MRRPCLTGGSFQDDLRGVAVGSGQSRPRWMESRQDAGTCGRAERTCRVGPVKGHPASRQPLEVGGFVELGMTVQHRIRPAQIIGEDEEKVGFFFRRGSLKKRGNKDRSE